MIFLYFTDSSIVTYPICFLLSTAPPSFWATPQHWSKCNLHQNIPFLPIISWYQYHLMFHPHLYVTMTWWPSSSLCHHDLMTILIFMSPWPDDHPHLPDIILLISSLLLMPIIFLSIAIIQFHHFDSKSSFWFIPNFDFIFWCRSFLTSNHP